MPRMIPTMPKIPFNAEYAQNLRERVLLHIEKMAYKDVQDMPFAVIELFEQTYPERCPQVKSARKSGSEKPARQGIKSNNPNQLRLF